MSPPGDDMLLSADLRELSALVGDGRTSTATLQAKLDAVSKARVAPPVLHTFGGHGTGIGASIGALSRERVSIRDLLSGLYLPAGANAWYVPPERRYAFGQAWRSPAGAASASKDSGSLTAYTHARLAGTNDHSDAGVYIRVPTTGGGFGQVNRMRLEADISWSGRSKAAMDWEWARFAAGSVHVAGRLWLVAYEHNVATNTYEPLLNNSAVNTVLFHQSLNGPGASPLTTAGNLSGNSLALEFIVSPARDYLLGVVAQTRVYHNLVHADGSPHQLREPTPSEFNSYAVLDVTVSDMWVSHVVLAP
ncbi:MAG: hypothetical protein KIT22_12330 [Verrucomicrobiae bacterium]|nr:hypothetical protein [Verrucomicrobiae bacterium]